MYRIFFIIISECLYACLRSHSKCISFNFFKSKDIYTYDVHLEWWCWANADDDGDDDAAAAADDDDDDDADMDTYSAADVTTDFHSLAKVELQPRIQ